ncbi:MAG: alpha/beta hydrolase [Acidimicrobiales bacterium]
MRTAPAIGMALLALTALVGCGGDERGRAVEPPATGTPAGPSTTYPPATPSTSPSPTDAATGGVTRTTVTFVDPTRGTVARPPQAATNERVLVTTVRRPASGGGPWPLVVFGHGFDISSEAYATLLDEVAGSGFVVASPELPGSSTARPGQPDEHDLAQEPCDLTVVAADVESASAEGGELAGTVRPGPIALAGQSDGATAAAFAALAVDPCRTAASPVPVGAVVAFSAKPVPADAIDPGLTHPPAALAVTGSADTVNPPSHTRDLFDQWPAEAWLVTSAGDGHLAPSTDSGRRLAIDAVVVDFLRGTLEADHAALGRMAIDASVPGLTLEHRG